MIVGDAVDRAMAIREEIAKRLPDHNEHIIAALITAAALYQIGDWLEDKLERIVQFLPER